ncbi:hypothetical protein [uncultured Rothia sp.]|uniref:hypothetical protein n=1 Tax=uncultured Rothia sp. TaxID=316088 RepID=UPI0028DC4571|nr:hypothetical protein [uncultured Rothia sp.]
MSGAQYPIEQDGTIDVTGTTTHSTVDGFSGAYTLLLRSKFGSAPDATVNGMPTHTGVADIPTRVPAEENAPELNLGTAANESRSDRKAIGYFIDQWDDMEKFDVYVDMDYQPVPSDTAKATGIALSSCTADIYQASKLKNLDHKAMYIVQYRQGEVLATLDYRDSHPKGSELDVIGVIGRILQIISTEEVDK